MASNSLSPLSILTPKPQFPPSTPQFHSLPLSLPSLSFSSNKKTTSNILHKTTTTTPKGGNHHQHWKIHAVSDNTTIASQDIIPSPSTDDSDVTTTIISVLLFLAFLGLTILTIGVIYLGVTDFLQKREKEKFEKEEAAKRKKSGKKRKKVRTRAGPRGFGQKIDEDNFDDLDDD